jgi:succinate-semialdehyde dehydrogenase/glutarate-semialdehyde dehydrogenase
VGKQLAAMAGQHMKRVTMELGGHAPVIVCEDADIALAVKAAGGAKFRNAGQVCVSPTRFLVHESVYGRFVDQFVAAAKAIKVGNGLEKDVRMGPLANARRVDAMEQFVSDAVAKGAKVETGGKRGSEAGSFFEPTVLTNVDHSMRIMREETFGPTLPIMRVDSEEEAIRLANDSPMGLDSSVFAGDPAHGEQVARRIQSGASIVNDALTNYLAMEIPIGGMKESGVGARHGRVGIQKYCQRQNLVVTRLGLNREIYYFPYSKGVAKLTEWLIVALFGRGSRRR